MIVDRKGLTTVSSNDGVKYASWDLWEPKSYLKTYFSKLGPDSIKTAKFLTKELKKFEGKKLNRILEFGSGPTLFGAIPAAPYTEVIDVADYLESNLQEIRYCFDNKKMGFDWNDYIKLILNLEGAEINKASLKKRMALLKKSIRFFHCDASLSHPLGPNVKKYPLVISAFCADSATSSKEIWRIYMRNIIGMVSAGGTILISALRNCASYKVGNYDFPCAKIDENDLFSILSNNGYQKNNISIEICSVPECKSEGFTSMMLACASFKIPLITNLK